MSSLVAPALDAPAMRRYGPPELVFGASPAAGADFSAEVGEGYWSRLLSVHVRLVCSAAAANREVVVEYRDVQDQRFALYGAPVTFPASDTIDYVFSSFQRVAEWEVDGTVIVPLGSDLLYPGTDFRIHVVNVQAADQLSRIRFQRERFYPPDDIGQPS